MPPPMEISDILHRLGMEYDGWNSSESAVARVYKVKKGKKSSALRMAQLGSEVEFHQEIINRQLVEHSDSSRVKQDVLPHMPHLEQVDAKSKYVVVTWIEGTPLMEEAETLNIPEIHQIATELVKYMNGWHTLGRTVNDIDTPNKMDRILISAKAGKPISWVDLDANTMGILEHQLKVKDQLDQPEFQVDLQKFRGIEQIVTILTNSHLNNIIEHINYQKLPALLQEFSDMNQELTGQLNLNVLAQLAMVPSAELSKKFGIDPSNSELVQVIAKALSIQDGEERDLYAQSVLEKGTIISTPNPAIAKDFARKSNKLIEAFAVNLPNFAFAEVDKPVDVNDHLGYIRMTLKAIESLPDVAIARESTKIVDDYDKLSARIIDLLRSNGKFQDNMINDLRESLAQGVSLASPRRNMSEIVAANMIYSLDEYLLPKSPSRKSISKN